MNAESKKIHEDYEKLFGKAKRVNLFDTDEENETLHQYILAQPHTSDFRYSKLPLDEVKVETYRVFALNEIVNDVSAQGHRVFWLCTSQKNCDAAGYYNDVNGNFTILKFSKISDTETESFDVLSVSEHLQRNSILKSKTEVDKDEGLYLTENVACKNPHIAAIIVTGRSKSIDMWKDKNGITLEQAYPQINSPKVGDKGLKSIITSLEENIRRIKNVKNDVVVSKEHEAQYFFKIRDVVKAMGYYEPSNGHFFILKDSLLSIYSLPEFSKTKLGKDRAEMVETHCMLDKKYYRVTDEIECENASIAASYVIGNNAQFFMWKDASGVTLKSNHPTNPPVKVNTNTISVKTNTPTFYLKRDISSGNYCNAYGTFDPKTNRFFIKAGSLLSLNVSPTFSSSTSLRRKIFLKIYCTKQSEAWLVNKDGICSSPSAAAAIVLGRNANGRTVWVDKNGYTLNEIFPN